MHIIGVIFEDQATWNRAKATNCILLLQAQYNSIQFEQKLYVFSFTM